MTQWTHGPWNTSGYLGNVTVTDSQGYVIAHVEYERRERLANARLIALAPEMAQGLRAIMQVLDGSQPMDPKGALFVAQTLLARVDA